MDNPLDYVNCGRCWEHVLGLAVRTHGRIYHDRCFRCNQCEKPLDKNNQLVDGKLYCNPCYVVKYRPKCERCQQIIADRQVMNAGGKVYHSNCFCCVKCSKRLEPNQYWECNGAIYCQRDLADAAGRASK